MIIENIPVVINILTSYLESKKKNQTESCLSIQDQPGPHQIYLVHKILKKKNRSSVRFKPGNKPD